MIQEIELKLRLKPNIFSQLPPLITTFKSEKYQVKELINTYFDSKDFAFSKQKSIVRVRECDGNFTLTAKLKGQVTGGLHAHPEFNLALKNNRPNLEALEQKFNIELPCRSEDLQPLFQTNFKRQCWHISDGKNKFELALDCGEVVSQNKREPIQELECELIDGDALAIFPFIAQLFSSFDGATLSATNKAQRGYALTFGDEEKEVDYFALWQEKSPATEIEKILLFLTFEQNLIEDFVYYKQNFAESLNKVIALLGAFFHLYEEMNNSSFFQYLQNRPLPAHFGDDNLLDDLAILNQIAHNELKNIIFTHSQQKDNNQALNRLESWLFSNAQLQRLLRLTAIAYFQQ